MDPDHAFLRVHARLSGVLSQLITPRVRSALEYLSLAFALSVLCLLVVMHANFVHQPGCSSELSGVELGEAQLVLIKIRGGGLWAQNAADKSIVDSQNQGGLAGSFVTSDVNGDEPPLLSATFWANWIGSGARSSKLIFKSWKNYKEYSEPRAEMNTDERGGLHKGFPVSFEESFKAAVVRLCDKWNICVSSLWKIGKRFSRNAGELRETAGWKVLLEISKFFKLLHIKHLNSSIMQWLERRSKAFEPTYLFTAKKGYFLLPEGAKARYDIQTFNITISAQNSCFGNRWHRLLINTFIGYDTILMNSLMSYPGQGYLYNFQTKEFYDLSYGHGLSEGPARFGDYIVTKCGVLIMSLFVFFTTTMSVSFIIRETQSRMLKFTAQLQRHARHQLPTFQLIFVHVTGSLVFIPIMIGILFFLFEFYDDQLLAFLVLTLLLLCEFFKLISVRTSISMQFFPRFVLLYFLVFHIYFFSYTSGFSYLAFSATTAFMQHLILCFWNRFEVPALQRFVRAQAQLQQQEAGVEITSSTIYTSTLHISRVNVRNANSNNNEMEPRFELPSRPDHARSNDPLLPAESTGTRGQLAGGSLDSTTSSLQSTALNPQQQMETTHGSILLNPFNSFLIWILGGASSDGIISFFSMFRDIGDQGQDYRESPPQDTEPIT